MFLLWNVWFHHLKEIAVSNEEDFHNLWMYKLGLCILIVLRVYSWLLTHLKLFKWLGCMKYTSIYTFRWGPYHFSLQNCSVPHFQTLPISKLCPLPNPATSIASITGLVYTHVWIQRTHACMTYINICRPTDFISCTQAEWYMYVHASSSEDV